MEQTITKTTAPSRWLGAFAGLITVVVGLLAYLSPLTTTAFIGIAPLATALLAYMTWRRLRGSLKGAALMITMDLSAIVGLVLLFTNITSAPEIGLLVGLWLTVDAATWIGLNKMTPYPRLSKFNSSLGLILGIALILIGLLTPFTSFTMNSLFILCYGVIVTTRAF